MASLKSLKLQGLRNIPSADFSSFSRINIFYGANGAGKTSLLEAVHLLGLGRSFRHSRHKPLIAYDSQELVVYGEILADTPVTSPGATTGLGIRRDRQGNNEIRIRGQRAASVAELATLFPLQVINEDTFQLLLGAPGLRRQFLDWGVFHVEQHFLERWRRLQRGLKQRNSLLRRGNIGARELQAWDPEFIQLAESITRSREHYFSLWLPELLRLLERIWPPGGDLEFTFAPGWDTKTEFATLLHKQIPRDLALGYTAHGPHRADIKIRMKGMPAGEILSRGQLKLLSASMRLAQAVLLAARMGVRCTFLIDDLPSELDDTRRALLCKSLDELQGQVFLTTIDSHSLADSGFNQQELSVFHVEHGAVYQQ